MTPAKAAALALHQPGPNDSKDRTRNLVRASIVDDNWPRKVQAFRKLYNLSRFDRQTIGNLSPLRRQLHAGMFTEEFAETIGFSEFDRKELVHQARDIAEYVSIEDEHAFEDLVELVDGILDTIYVGLGWLAELGLTPTQINLLMEEVHASNLTKVDNSGQPVYDDHGKVQKGENYQKADIAGLLRQFIAEAAATKEPTDG